MHNIDLNILNERFGIKEQLIFKRGANDFVMLEVANSLASASLALQGAQLLTWAPTGHHPVIWLSKDARYQLGKSVRGGLPLCWTWFGPHVSDSSFIGHGFARTACWEVSATETLGDGSNSIVFRLVSSDEHYQYWPYSTPLELHVVVGRELTMELHTRNIGVSPVTIGQAFHTYFEISDIRNVSIRGLDGCRYLDKVDGGKEKRQSGPVTFSGETDRIYLDTDAECVIEDPGMSRRISIGKRGSFSTVVWNPWVEKAAKLGDMGETVYLNMVCVESANAADDVVTLQPGENLMLAVNYAVEATN